MAMHTLDAVPADTRLSLDDIAAMSGVTPRALWLAIQRDPTFPRPATNKRLHTEWRAGDLRRWLKLRSRA